MQIEPRGRKRNTQRIIKGNVYGWTTTQWKVATQRISKKKRLDGFPMKNDGNWARSEETKRSGRAYGCQIKQQHSMEWSSGVYKARQLTSRPRDCRYSLFLPIHHLWVAYIAELLNLPKQPETPKTPPTLNVPVAHAKLVKADFHGAIITGELQLNHLFVPRRSFI